MARTGGFKKYLEANINCTQKERKVVLFDILCRIYIVYNQIYITDKNTDNIISESAKTFDKAI